MAVLLVVASIVTSPFYAAYGFLRHVLEAAMWLILRGFEEKADATDFAISQENGRNPPTLTVSFRQGNHTNLEMRLRRLTFDLCFDGIVAAHFDGLFGTGRHLQGGPFIPSSKERETIAAVLVPRLETWAFTPRSFQLRDGELTVEARALGVRMGTIVLPIVASDITFLDTPELKAQRRQFFAGLPGGVNAAS